MKNIPINTKSNVVINLIVLALLIAGVAYGIATSSPDETTGASLPTTVASKDGEAASTSDTYAALQGEAFDEQYIAGMFAHHEGAVNMSEKALAFAGKQEIKNLANDIVQSQSREMATLLDWQEQWGYKRTYGGGHNGHIGGGAAMADDMISMQDSLEGKEGKEFDVIFLICQNLQPPMQSVMR